MQVCTQFYGRRPYGVGMLVAGCDVSGVCCVVKSHHYYYCYINYAVSGTSLVSDVPLFQFL